MAVQLLTSAIAVELMREERVVAAYEMRSVEVHRVLQQALE
jgi:hypothetical protein